MSLLFHNVIFPHALQNRFVTICVITEKSEVCIRDEAFVKVNTVCQLIGTPFQKSGIDFKRFNFPSGLLKFWS